jgi:hypothetical protein
MGFSARRADFFIAVYMTDVPEVTIPLQRTSEGLGAAKARARRVRIPLKARERRLDPAP